MAGLAVYGCTQVKIYIFSNFDAIPYSNLNSSEGITKFYLCLLYQVYIYKGKLMLILYRINPGSLSYCRLYIHYTNGTCWTINNDSFIDVGTRHSSLNRFISN